VVAGEQGLLGSKDRCLYVDNCFAQFESSNAYLLGLNDPSEQVEHFLLAKLILSTKVSTNP